ncbi:hypothetical protein MKX03_022546 [Papaver bracteatum]|nr:hypothetical protein MKX03_022546 [Papaver bracteatum]
MYKMKGYASALASTSSFINRSIMNQTKMTVRGCATSSDNRGRHFVVKPEDMETDENMMSLYERWMVYQEIYRDEEEKHRRFPVFQERVRRCRSANCFADSFKYEINKIRVKNWGWSLKRHQSLED